MTQTPMRLPDLPRRLEEQAKAAPSWRCWGLDVQVGTRETLRDASRVATANTGAPGIAGVPCEDLAASGGEPLREPLRDALVARTYPPMRGRRKARPTDGGTKVRGLGMPPIRDRGVQGARQLILEPSVEAAVQPGADGDRPQRSAQAAVPRVAEALAQ